MTLVLALRRPPGGSTVGAGDLQSVLMGMGSLLTGRNLSLSHSVSFVFAPLSPAGHFGSNEGFSGQTDNELQSIIEICISLRQDVSNFRAIT